MPPPLRSLPHVASVTRENTKTVSLLMCNSSIRVAPVPTELIRALGVKVHVACEVAGRGRRVYAATTQMANIRTEGAESELWTSLALEPVVRLALSQAGYQIKTFGCSSGPLAAPLITQSPHGDPADRLLLDLVQHNERGLIRVGNNVSVAWLIAQMALAWPEKTIAVAVARREEVQELANALRGYELGVSVITGKNNPGSVSRVVVSTYVGLAHSAAAGARRRPIEEKRTLASWFA
jgi:hypothetical protein